MNKYMDLLLKSDFKNLMYRGMPEEYGQKLSSLISQEETFQSTVSPEEQIIFQQIRRLQADVREMENHAHFIIGFQFGVNLLLEALRQN